MRDTELLLRMSKVPRDTTGELNKVNRRIDDINVSTNGPIVGSKKHTVEVTEPTNRVHIGIPEFTKTRDVLLTYVNSIFIEEGSDYRISENGEYIEKIEGVWAESKPKTFNFIALMNMPGLSGGENDYLYGVKVVNKKTRTYIEAATNEVAIGIPQYSKNKDIIEVHVNGVYLAEGTDYTVSSDSAKIIKSTGNWEDCVVNINVLMNIIANDLEMDGKLLINNTVAEEKLSPEVIEKLNRRRGVEYLAVSNEILLGAWTGPNSDGMYTARVEHALNSDKLLVAGLDNASKRNVMLSFKIIDLNTIEVEVDTKCHMILSVISSEDAIITELPDYSQSINTIHLNKTDWVADGDMKKKVITHNLRSKNLIVSAYDRESGMNLMVSSKIIDVNTIEIRSDEVYDCDIMIAYKSVDSINPNFQINDSVVGDATTYSSKKIEEKFNGVGATVDTKLAGLVDSAPETLNTLNELAGALGNDPNFATTVATQIGAADSKAVTALEKANEAFQSGVNVKNNMVQAINSKKTVPDLTGDEQWEIITQRVKDIKEGSGNAVAGDVLAGKTFTNSDGVEYTGTIPDRGGAVTVTPGTTNQVKPGGYYGGDITVVGSGNLIASNIRSGVNIFGVVGTSLSAPTPKPGKTHTFFGPRSEATATNGTYDFMWVGESSPIYLKGTYTISYNLSGNNTGCIFQVRRGGTTIYEKSTPDDTDRDFSEQIDLNVGDVLTFYIKPPIAEFGAWARITSLLITFNI